MSAVIVDELKYARCSKCISTATPCWRATSNACSKYGTRNDLGSRAALRPCHARWTRVPSMWVSIRSSPERSSSTCDVSAMNPDSAVSDTSEGAEFLGEGVDSTGMPDDE